MHAVVLILCASFDHRRYTGYLHGNPCIRLPFPLEKHHTRQCVLLDNGIKGRWKSAHDEVVKGEIHVPPSKESYGLHEEKGILPEDSPFSPPANSLRPPFPSKADCFFLKTLLERRFPD